MAVFLLKASQGSSFHTPACAGIFSDVACTPGHGFADWIENLYNRGITAGCQASGRSADVLPDRDVLRSEMAVFLLKASRGPATLRRPAPASSRTSLHARRGLLRLDRGPLQPRHHRRLPGSGRSAQVLPGQQHSPPGDGGLPRQDLRPAAVRTIAASNPERAAPGESVSQPSTAPFPLGQQLESGGRPFTQSRNERFSPPSRLYGQRN